MTNLKIAFALTVAGITSAAMPAVAAMSMNERPQGYSVADSNTNKTEVVAGAHFNARELAMRGLKADDIVSLSVFASSGMVDDSSRNDL